MAAGEGGLWRTAQAAKALSVTERHLQRLAEKKLIPHVRLGERALRFDPEAVMAWVKAGGVTQGPKTKRQG